MSFDKDISHSSLSGRFLTPIAHPPRLAREWGKPNARLFIRWD